MSLVVGVSVAFDLERACRTVLHCERDLFAQRVAGGFGLQDDLAFLRVDAEDLGGLFRAVTVSLAEIEVDAEAEGSRRQGSSRSGRWGCFGAGRH